MSTKNQKPTKKSASKKPARAATKPTRAATKRKVTKPLGRPVSTGRSSGQRVTVRLSDEEAKLAEKLASAEEMSVAEWFRTRGVLKLGSVEYLPKSPGLPFSPLGEMLNKRGSSRSWIETLRQTILVDYRLQPASDDPHLLLGCWREIFKYIELLEDEYRAARGAQLVAEAAQIDMKRTAAAAKTDDKQTAPASAAATAARLPYQTPALRVLTPQAIPGLSIPGCSPEDSAGRWRALERVLVCAGEYRKAHAEVATARARDRHVAEAVKRAARAAEALDEAMRLASPI